jgi:hypothetical protein
MSSIMPTLGRRGRTLAILLVAVIGVTTAAWAYWSSPSKGSASGHVASLNAPTIPSATGGAESVALSWSSVTAPGSGAVDYYVSRDGSAPSGNCPASSSPSTATSCTDAGVPAGNHSYTVTAVWRSWTATSSARAVTTISSPTVTAANPGSRAQGTSGQTIAITGSHFVSGASATFSGTGVTVNSTTFKSSTELTASISVAAGATTGARSVTVTNPDSGTGTGTGIFTVNAAPTVTSTSPSSRGQGATGQTVDIKGSGFVSGAGATFGAGITVNSTTFKSSTELTAEITIASSASPGVRTVTVTNPDTGVGSLASGFTVTTAPTVTSTNPSSRGQGATGQTVAIKGSGFVNGASSSFGSGITVNSTTFKSSTELTANITIESGASTGARAVAVTNPDGGVGSLAGAFTVTTGPNVESTSPSSRPQGASGQAVTIKGSGFVSGVGLAVSFSGTGITVNSTTFKSSTELTANITIASGASAGARTVTVTNPDTGADSLAGGFTVDALPNIESASPSSGNRGGTELVAIKGTGFASGAGLAVSFSGTGITVNSTSFVSTTEVTANVTIAANATTGARNVTVTNPDTGSDTQSSAFTVNSASTVTQASPSSRGQGSSSQTVVIKGTNFESGAGLGVSFSGTGITVNSTSFVSTTEVTANVTIAANATTGARNVTVTNPDTTTATGIAVFAVTAAPIVTSTNPSSRGQGATGQTVAIKGSGFVNGASSSFGSGITVNSTTFKSSTELTANITIESGASTGARAVAVTNPDGGVGSLAGAFTVNAGPNVESTSPSSRSQGASKQTIAIKGSGFVSGATPSFGSGIAVESTGFVSSTELSVKVAVESGAVIGARTVTVTNPDGGTDSLASGFTVTAGPSIESIAPNTGDKGGSETVTIKGAGFVSGIGLAVSFSGTGITVNSTSFVSSTELTTNITIASGASTGARTVTVTNPDSGAGSLASAFTVNNGPSIESISPNSRAQGASSQTIVVKGANFESGTGLVVSFSGAGITVNSTSFVSATEVTANVTITANATTGARTLTLTNPDTTTASGSFTVNAPPTVTSTSPSSRGQGATGQTVAIKGSGFISGASAAFGPGITVNSTTFKSSIELTANITIESAASTGSRTVTVTNPDAGVGSLASGFTVNAGPTITSPTSSVGKVKIARSSPGEFKVLGSGFVSGMTVSISGGFTVTSTTFVNSGELKVKVTAGNFGQRGDYDLTVTNPDGGSDISENSIENT